MLISLQDIEKQPREFSRSCSIRQGNYWLSA